MRVFVIAGEASGDKLGAAILQGLKALRPDVEFAGIGGPMMEAEGLASLFPMRELSVMGLAEILPKYPALLRRKREVVAAALDYAPDILLTIDSPGFCLRVAKEVRAADPAIKTVHYVAPSVWAWRPGRAAKMARYIDKVLTLLPFEPPLMEAAGMQAQFVGHPVVAEPLADAAGVAAFRAEQGAGPLVLVLPGSRMGEVTRLTGELAKAVHGIVAAKPEARAVVVMADGVETYLETQRAAFPKGTRFVQPKSADEKRAVFAAADVALAASGTVSLELAAAHTPMVIGYDMAWLSRILMARLMLVDTVTLVNLVSETRAVPEFLGKDFSGAAMAEAALGTLDAPEAQLAAMRTTLERLGQGGEAPGLRAARALLD